MSQWVTAWEFCEREGKRVPEIIRKFVWKRAAPILDRKARSKSRPAIRFQKGTKTPQKEKKELHGECEALCKALVFHRDCGDWRAREGNCITCGHWRTLQWGHFIKRQRAPALLYSVQATGGQCAGCNGPGDGEALKYAEAIDRRDGDGSAARLMTFFYKLKWTWSKTALTGTWQTLALQCRAKGIDPAAVLAEWKGPKTEREALPERSEGSQSPNPKPPQNELAP